MAPHRHLVVDVTVTSARTNTNVPHICDRLPLPGTLALGAQHVKVDADLRTSALLGMPSVQSVHDYYPVALEDGGRSAPLAVKLVDRRAIFVAFRRFHGMGDANSRSLHSDMSIRMQHFDISCVDILLFPFDVLGGMMCGENSCNVFLLFFMTLWVLIFATLCRRAMLMLWHAFLFLRLRPPGFVFCSSLLLFDWWFPLPLIFTYLFYKNQMQNNKSPISGTSIYLNCIWADISII
jgi:hypothetical protein